MNGNNSDLVPSPRKGQRIKKMSLNATECLNTKVLLLSDSEDNYSFEGSSSDDEVYYTSEDERSSSEYEEDSVECDDPKLKIIKEHKEQRHEILDKNINRWKDVNTYVIKSDNYFYNSKGTRKCRASKNTLHVTHKPQLSQDEFRKLFSKISCSGHKHVISELNKQSRTYFSRWMSLLHEGFNILLYGLGSKKNTLHQFHKEYLNNLPVIVVNGFFPSLSLKEILDSIILEILESHEFSGNTYEATDYIAEQFSMLQSVHLYIIIHNIDGELLHSNARCQSILAKLASVKNIHLVVSIDHISAPLIWDHNKLSKFNFTWWDVTSFSHYLDETAFETSIVNNKSGSLTLSSLRNIFLSLTSNSKGIYLLVAKHQLQNANQYYQGMLFKDLYWACREAFLVSSDLALRAQLTEFVDHKMIKLRRSIEGAEHLIIPISNKILQQFLSNDKQ